ncbi:MAG: hypothetical protein ACTSRW_10740 [Candidatus Helarchaeota archaeon]
MSEENFEFYKRIDYLLGFLNHTEQFTNIELKMIRSVEKALKHGYHKTSLRTAQSFFPGIDIEKLYPLLRIEDNKKVILNTKYNLYRGIHEEHFENVRNKGILKADDTNKHPVRGPVIRLTPHIFESAKYAYIKTQTAIYGMIIEIEPHEVKNLQLGQFGLERFNTNEDISVDKYRIYEVKINHLNPRLYYFNVISKVLKEQDIDLKEILKNC